MEGTDACAATLFDDEHEEFRDSFRALPRQGGRSRTTTSGSATGIVPRRCSRRPAPTASSAWPIPEELRRRRASTTSASTSSSARRCQRPARRARARARRCTTTSACPYFLRLRHRRAEGALAARASLRRADHRDRDDRAGHRLRPGGDDDDRAIRDGDHYVVNGSKTFITNGINADLVDHRGQDRPDAAARGHVPARARAGHGGLRARPQPREDRPCTRRTPPSCSSPTSACRSANLLGDEGAGLRPPGHEPAPGAAVDRGRRGGGRRAALDWTLEYVKERTAFGQPIGSFQNTRFALAEMATEVEIAQAFIDRCVVRAQRRRARPPRRPPMAKWWCTELQERVVDRVPAAARRLRLHDASTRSPGPTPTPASRTIYGGTTEIMKEIIGRSLGL